jgi:hypothetical protein
MANTYRLIEAKTLASAAASVTFSSIPQTYTDLVLKISARQGAENAFNFRLNGDSSSVYSFILTGGDGSSATSSASSSVGQIVTRGINPSVATANTFGNAEIYIPNYTNTSYNKSISVEGVNENNATEIYMNLVAGLWSNTSAITSMEVIARAGNLVQYSTFYLYGIKNS